MIWGNYIYKLRKYGVSYNASLFECNSILIKSPIKELTQLITSNKTVI